MLTRHTNVLDRTGPVVTELVLVVSTMLVSALRLLHQVAMVGMVRQYSAQFTKVSDKHALERSKVILASIWFGWLAKNAVRVEVCGLGGRVGNGLSLGQIGLVFGGMVQLDQTTNYHTLVVGECRSLRMTALQVLQSIIDELFFIDHSSSFEPCPYLLGLVQIFLVT